MFPIANNVRAEREARGMTQSELGATIGLTRQTIAAIEQRRYSPSLEAAFRIARLFGMTVDDLFRWEEGAAGGGHGARSGGDFRDAGRP
jgi:putative transcriptional regulator